MSFELYSQLSTLPFFKNIYEPNYNDYVIETIKPSIILKEMIQEAITPKDILEIIKFFDIKYTNNYYDLSIDNVSSEISNISDFHSPTNISLDITN
tara:strand:- start:4930 stop:5217 length:288 start_codon:yes stop_codon:yes gene_type:complete